MIVTVKSAVKLGKEKSAVWVQFLAPSTHEGFKMQMYPLSHEPSRGVGQGQDFSILSTLVVTSPRATTFLDLGITDLTSAKVTSAMLLAFSSLPRLPVFTDIVAERDFTRVSLSKRKLALNRAKVKKFLQKIEGKIYIFLFVENDFCIINYHLDNRFSEAESESEQLCR